MKKLAIIPLKRIENKIYHIRGQKVMLDSDLAEIYGVTTKRLNEQVKRNLQRFPKDFMFALTVKEENNLMSQNATSSWGGKRKVSRVFTEHGAVMLASVLTSTTAINASLLVVRAFVKLREILSTHKELAAKLKLLENRVDTQDYHLINIFKEIDKLIHPANPPRKKIGYKIPSK